MNINIDKITLDINGKKLELTLQECEELKKLLDSLVEKKPEITISSPWIINDDKTIKSPFKIGDYPPYISPYPNPTITWSQTGGTSNNENYKVIGVYCTN